MKIIMQVLNIFNNQSGLPIQVIAIRHPPIQINEIIIMNTNILAILLKMYILFNYKIYYIKIS